MPKQAKIGQNRPKFCVLYAKKYTGLKKNTLPPVAVVGAKTNVLFDQNKTNRSLTFYDEKRSPIKVQQFSAVFSPFQHCSPQKTRHIFSQQQQLYDWVHPCVSVSERTRTGGFSEKVFVGRCEVRQDREKTKVSHGIGTRQRTDPHSGKWFRMDNCFSTLWWYS